MKLLKYKNLNSVLIYITGFIILAILTLTCREWVRKLTANQLEYITAYQSDIGKSVYFNEEINSKKDKVLERYAYEDDFFEKDTEWININRIHNKNLVIIEWFSRFVFIVLSLSGFLIFRYRQKRQKTSTFIDWYFYFVSLFFLSDLGMDILGIIGYCRNYSTSFYLNLPYVHLQLILISIEMIAFAIILSQLPKRQYFQFLTGGFIGGIFGFLLWFNLMQELYPSKLKTDIAKTGKIAKELNGIIHGSNDSFYLSDYNDSIVLLDFFFTTCEPCRRIIPELNLLHEKYQTSGIVFRSIDPIEKDWKKLDLFLTKFKINYPIVKVKGKTSRKNFGVSIFPSIIIINKGKIIFNKPVHKSNLIEVELLIKELLKEDIGKAEGLNS